MQVNVEEVLILARHIVSVTGCSPEEAANNPVIPLEYQEEIKERLTGEQLIHLVPSIVVSEEKNPGQWLNERDRSEWYYWPRLRRYLLENKEWRLDRVSSLDDSSDSVLKNISSPETEGFEKRGLVLGYVQSGKTANYTALIAKAADVGYRLFIVLAGMDNGLRRQTQIRIEQEIVGHADASRNAVDLPPRGKQWHVLTTNDINGDFNSGSMNAAALQGGYPVLMVIKKNGSVLRRVISWLAEDITTIQQLPVLIIDDEADQASIDTRGSRMTEGQEQPEDYEEPSTINRLIRQLLRKFKRHAFVAYTATPFANILIPANQHTPDEGQDLYPRDFIIDLPKPNGYLGAEDLFGRGSFTGDRDGDDGKDLDVFRPIPDSDMEDLGETPSMPLSLETAILDFVLAGAARYVRGHGDKPAAMLVHTSHLVGQHESIKTMVDDELKKIKDGWRYDRKNGIENKMKERWNKDFEPAIQNAGHSSSITFNEVQNNIGKFVEVVDIKVVNSQEGDTLDYEDEPKMKSIIIGGNKLSRGLTIEGLLISYFTRQPKTPMYDTVMQMGRWFGYREGYADLTRIYMTSEWAGRFFDLAQVEHRLREDMIIYTRQGVTPRNFGMRILQHPSMLVTSRSKQRHAKQINISYSGSLFQTFRFPLDDPKLLAEMTENNLKETKRFLSSIGSPQKHGKHIVWRDIDPSEVLYFLSTIQNKEHSVDFLHVRKYIKARNGEDELIKWTVAISQLQKKDSSLKTVDWGINMKINQISRTRLLKKVNSLGVITEPKDERIAFSPSELDEIDHREPESTTNKNYAVRSSRNPKEGLLLLYPISKYSAPKRTGGSRVDLFDDPDTSGQNLIGISIPFPVSQHSIPEPFVVNTDPGWAEDDE